MRFTLMPLLRICAFAAVGTADALRATRRQCCNFVAATAALAADKACAVDSNVLEDAFFARTKVLRSVPCGNQPVRRVHRAVERASHRWRRLRRIFYAGPLQAGTCDAKTPDWLVGDWTVAASRFEGVSFPQSGSYFPRGGFTQTIAGARRGTILAIPNAGATPKGYARSYASTLATSSDVTNAAATLKAFWSDATDIAVDQSAKRTVIRYTAPTVKRGVLPQRIVADRLACASESPSPSSLIVAERWAQASVVDDADAALTSLSGTYTAWHRYDRVDQGVRETLRVAAFDDSPAADDIRPAAVYDYSFFLRRRAGR